MGKAGRSWARPRAVRCLLSACVWAILSETRVAELCHLSEEMGKPSPESPGCSTQQEVGRQTAGVRQGLGERVTVGSAPGETVVTLPEVLRALLGSEPLSLEWGQLVTSGTEG